MGTAWSRSATMLAHVFMVLSICGCGMSRQQEIQLGQEAKPQFEQEFGGLHTDDSLQRYVQDIGMSLAEETDRPDLPWQFRVLQSEQVNAFALPGGFIYITAGLLRRLENEAQLAAVLSHEVGHVAHRHSVRQLQRAQIVQGGSALASIFAEGAGTAVQLGQVVAGLALMKYGRDQEREADLSGLSYMTRENYEPSEMLDVMETLKRASNGQAPPEFFSSHPTPDNRKNYLSEELREAHAGRISYGRTDRQEFEQIVSQALGPAPAAEVASDRR